MSSNRQPKDRQKALTSHLERCYAHLDEAQALYDAGALSVHVSTSREGKIRGIKSISVSPSFDCLMRWINQKEGMICGHCYAVGALMTYRQTMIRRLIQNAYLMSRPIQDHAIPRGLIGPVRFNAFGEVLNEYHAQWVLAIVRANPKAVFSLITKQVNLFPMNNRPKNLILISSKFRIDDTSIDERADKTYCVISEPETDEMKRDPMNHPCQDGCLQCYIHDEGCYSKRGPKRILRQLQKVN